MNKSIQQRGDNRSYVSWNCLFDVVKSERSTFEMLIHKLVCIVVVLTVVGCTRNRNRSLKKKQRKSGLFIAMNKIRDKNIFFK